MTPLMTYEEMIRLAWKASEQSYSPYSGFRVGACLLGESGACYTGCNVENVAYSPSNCAERTAFFTAVAAGERSFRAIAVVGERADGAGEDSYTPPCGVCRQVMLEFCDPDSFTVVLGSRSQGFRTYLLREMLPHSFGSF